MTSHVAPRAERLMRWSLAPWERAAVLGDLEEEARAIAATRGVDAARRWYWQQAIASVWPNVTRRLRGDERRMAAFNGSLGGTVLWAGLAALQLLDAEAGGAWQRPVSALIISAAWMFRAVFVVRRVASAVERGRLKEMPATWDDVAHRDPAEHFGLINADIPLAGLDAGPYTLRVSVSDDLSAATADEAIHVIA